MVTTVIKDVYLQYLSPYLQSISYFYTLLGPLFYQFVTLPFSYLSALQVFTKVPTPLPLALLHSRGTPALGYLHDLHLWGQVAR